jgi:hypothetical protein
MDASSGKRLHIVHQLRISFPGTRKQSRYIGFIQLLERSSNLNLKEESLINNSLKSLSRCISSLCNDSVQDKYVPYRENTFTKVVSTSLEGDHICLFLCQMRNDFGDSLRNFQILAWLGNLQSEIEEVLVFDDDLEAIASMLEQQLANESEKQMILDQELSEVRCDEKYESAVNFGSQLLDIICEFSVISDSYFREVCQE